MKISEIISGLGAPGFWLFMALPVCAITLAALRRAQIRQEALIVLLSSTVYLLPKFRFFKTTGINLPGKIKPFYYSVMYRVS